MGGGVEPNAPDRPAGSGLAATVPYWLQILVVAAVYTGSAKLGLSLSVAYGNVTPVWAPTGISLAALLLFGARLWPGVALGAFVANVTTPIPPAAALGIAVGNTLEAYAGWWLIRRIGLFENRMERVRDVLVLVGLAAVVSTAISATIGSMSLLVANEIPASRYGYAWALWWFGDAMGDLLVAPLLLVWPTKPSQEYEAGRTVEMGLLTAGLVSASAFTFFGRSWSYPFLIFPFLIWATIRFRQRGATAAIFVVACLGIAGTLNGSVPIPTATLTQSVAILQTLLAISSVSMLILAATITERVRSELDARKSREQMVEAQQVAHVGSWEWDIVNDRITWSDELYRIYGIENPAVFEATYDAFLALVHPGDREMVDKNVRNSLETLSPFGFDHRIVRPDGVERVVHGRGSVVVDRDHNVIAMVGTGQDISGRKRAEEELRQSEERFRTIVETSEEGIVTTDARGIVTFANHKVAELLGCAAEELTGRSLVGLADGPEREDLRSLIRDATMGASRQREIRFRARDGSGDLWTLVSAGHFPASVPGAVLMIGDVGERKRLEKLRDTFIANAAHELRTPIASMVGFAALLAQNRDTLSEDKLRHVIDRMNWHGERLRRLVDGLLDLTRLQQGRKPMDPQRVTISDAVRDALAAVPVPKDKSVTVDAEPGLAVWGDAGALDQILTNILANAFRYGGSHVRIEVRESGDGVSITVADDGDGVPQETVPHLFDPFVRGSNTTGTGGAGLGMAIVRLLVEALDGTISYEPASPKGAAFRIVLRAAMPSSAAASY